MHTIIGYIHICQKKRWQNSFDLLMNKIRESGLYEKLNILRISILSDNGVFQDNWRFRDPKIEIVYKGYSEEYERPTLLLIKSQSVLDPDNTFYFYLHTKGVSHFGTEKEPYIIDWINLMLYWNIECWEKAVDILKKDYYWTYGCNHTGVHYSGNFWWTKKSHIDRLSNYIPNYYTATEDWVTMLYWGQKTVPIHSEFYSAFNSGLEGMGHYSNPYHESNYR